MTTGKQKILVIDDMLASIEIMSELMGDMCEVLFAQNGADGIELALAEQPDLILLDVMMPGMNGYEVCSILKNNPLTKTIPVIFVTAMYHDQDEARGLEIGAIDYITKPINPSIVRARIRNHLERKVIEHALREREQFLKLVIETEPECVKLLDRDGALLMMNRAGLDMIDAETFEMVKGHRVSELVNPEYREGFENMTRDAFEGNMGELAFEITGLKGRRLWLESHAVPLRNEQGTIISMLAITRDITVRKQALEALADKQQQLEALNSSLEQRISQAVAELRIKERMMIQQSRQAAMGEMINNIAHQWRQPLNNLGLILQNIEMGFDDGTLNGAELKADVHSSMEIIKFMSHTIDDFSNFFRPDKQLQMFRLKDAVLLAQKFVSANLLHHGITVDMDIDDDVFASGYPNEYAQVVLNILGNAKDALVATGVSEPCVRMEGRTEGGAAVLLVQDNGGGIREDVIDRIFDPYFTTKVEGKGTGIGLYMSKVIIENNMKGRLTVRNRDDGAEFRIEIPCAP